MGLFNKMDSRREVKFRSPAWKLTSPTWNWYSSFSWEIWIIWRNLGEKHFWINCGSYCIWGQNLTWGWQKFFQNQNKLDCKKFEFRNYTIFSYFPSFINGEGFFEQLKKNLTHLLCPYVSPRIVIDPKLSSQQPEYSSNCLAGPCQVRWERT